MMPRVALKTLLSARVMWLLMTSERVKVSDISVLPCFDDCVPILTKKVPSILRFDDAVTPLEVQRVEGSFPPWTEIGNHQTSRCRDPSRVHRGTSDQSGIRGEFD